MTVGGVPCDGDRHVVSLSSSTCPAVELMQQVGGLFGAAPLSPVVSLIHKLHSVNTTYPKE